MNTNTNKEKITSSPNKTVFINVMAVFFLAIGISAVTPALESIMQAFPNASMSSVYLILTLPTLITIPTSYISGVLAGRKVKFKTLIVFGLIVLTITGVMPFFMDNITAILVSRAFFGIGVGAIFPLGNALSLMYYGPQKGSKVMGYGNTSMNLGGITLQLIAGILCSIMWNYNFLVYLIGVIPLGIIIFTFKEPNVTAEISQQVSQQKEKVKLPAKLFVLCTIFALSIMAIYPMFLSLSTIIISEGYGDPSMAALLLSLTTLSGMIAGLIFGKMYEILKRFAMSVSILCGAVATGLIFIASSLVVLAVAGVFAGIAMTFLLCSTMMEIQKVVDPKAIPVASGICIAFMNIASFVATFYAVGLSSVSGSIDPVRFPFLIGAILCIVLSILWSMIHIKGSNNRIK